MLASASSRSKRADESGHKQNSYLLFAVLERKPENGSDPSSRDGARVIPFLDNQAVQGAVKLSSVFTGELLEAFVAVHGSGDEMPPAIVGYGTVNRDAYLWL